MKKTVAEGLKIVEEESQFMAVDKNLTQNYVRTMFKTFIKSFQYTENKSH